jgi:bifunctional UDP-N-acetylglucosamine pyrophosphorylase/glucosamine-1-phosphate N-acetyltransferase
MALEVVVLAAGQGKRMRSRLPKALHTLAGRPLLAHVLRSVRTLRPARIHVVVGVGADEVKAAFADEADVSWVLQRQQLGTGHAAAQAIGDIARDSLVLILFGDVPLVRAETLRACVDAAGDGIGLVTADMPDPMDLGRIVRGADGHVRAIVEARDANEETRAIREINTGIMAMPAALLAAKLKGLRSNNAQGELYLTDVISMAVADGVPVNAVKAPCPEEVAGINDRMQLAQLERFHQARLAEALMRSGVTLRDPSRIDIRGDVTAGEDCVIDVNVVFEGTVRLGHGVSIGAGAVIKDATLADGVTIHPHTVIDGAKIAAECEIGPFARMRPGTELAEHVKIGNFVETKKTRLGAGTKSNHFAYLGDTTTGEDCNIGAGTIMCNYDGVDKHPTFLGNRVFIGSNSTLVAPIKVGDDSYVAAGSTVTDEVNVDELAIGRSRQRNITGWTSPVKRKKQRSP